MSPVNDTVVALCSHMTPHYCQTHRKLILVCDMDETLITEVHNGERVLLRPKICYMLRSLRNLYELCMVTYSTRDRTDGILKRLLDPDGRIFGDRVLCREDIVPQYRNKLDAFLAHLPKSFGRDKNETHDTSCVIGNVKCRPSSTRQSVNRGFHTSRTRRPPVWTYVVVLDDFPLAWSNLSTCIPIRPFLADNFQRPRSIKSEGIYVLSLQRFLTKLHNAVFRDQRLALPQTESPADRLPMEQTRVNNTSAYSVVSKIRRRPSQGHRFQAMCHLDPGRLIEFDSKRTGARSLVRDSDDLGISRNLKVPEAPVSMRNTPTPWVTSHINEQTHDPIETEHNFISSYGPFQHLSEILNRESTQSTEDSDSIGTPSKQLIRHVYRRAKLIREVSAHLGKA